MSYTYIPNRVDKFSEYPEDQVDWITIPTSGLLVNNRWRTVRSLKHISNPATGDIRDQTYSLICTNFNITELPDIISGLELRIVAQRNGRIADELIHLTYQDQKIGKNNFNYITDSEGHLKITNESVYGGPTDLWDADITHEMLIDPSFGVILKFQSHPYYPHNVGMTLDSVSLTVY